LSPTPKDDKPPSREAQLRTLAAEALEQGKDPLHGSFLSAYEVTLEEVHELAEAMGLGLRLLGEAYAMVVRGGLEREIALHQLAMAMAKGMSAERVADQPDEDQRHGDVDLHQGDQREGLDGVHGDGS